jgi:hypothetical protein
MVGVAASRLDVRLRQELEEGEPLLLCELISVEQETGTRLVSGQLGVYDRSVFFVSYLLKNDVVYGRTV